jgi:hypothetical protein
MAFMRLKPCAAKLCNLALSVPSLAVFLILFSSLTPCNMLASSLQT